MERRRSRHPHPEAGQGGVREVAVVVRARCPLVRRAHCLKRKSVYRPKQLEWSQLDGTAILPVLV